MELVRSYHSICSGHQARAWIWPKLRCIDILLPHVHHYQASDSVTLYIYFWAVRVVDLEHIDSEARIKSEQSLCLIGCQGKTGALTVSLRPTNNRLLPCPDWLFCGVSIFLAFNYHLFKPLKLAHHYCTYISTFDPFSRPARTDNSAKGCITHRVQHSACSR